MINRLSSIWVLLLLLQTSLFGQAENVPYQKANDAFKLAFDNPDAALKAAHKLLRQAGNNKVVLANTYNAIGWAHMHKGNMDSSTWYLEEALRLFSAVKRIRDVARVNINLSEVYTRQSNYTVGLKYILKADSLSRKLKDISLQTDTKRQLGIIYRESGDKKKAAKFFNEALQGFEAQKDYAKYIDVVVSLSILFRSMDQADSSMHILQHAIVLADKHDRSRYQKAMLQEHLAESYLMKEAYHQALQHYLNAYKVFQELNNQGDMAYEAYCIGKTYTLLHQYTKAEQYLLTAYALSDSLGMLNFQVEIAPELSEMYAQSGRWPEAYRYAKQTTHLKDSLNITSQIAATNEIKERYEAKKRESEISLLQMKNSRMKWGFVASILAAALVGSLLWLLSYRRKIKEEKILNYFATSLYNQNTVDDVFWDIAKNCISRLNFEDCVIYGYDPQQKVLIQKAAFGPKNPDGFTITNLLEIPLGKGIVGAVANSLQPEIIKDTTEDPRYLIDDEQRLSEITIPIVLDGKLLGIIDSEHSKEGFYTKRHLKLLQRIADTCAKKLTKYFVEDSLRKQLASDLHDDLGSVLSSIDISSRTALAKKANVTVMEAHLKNISDQAQQSMENMSDIVWSVSPDNDTFESILSRMKSFAIDLCEPLNIAIDFLDIPADNYPGSLNAMMRKNIFLIFKEAVNNAAKYSACTLLSIQLDKIAPHTLMLTIRDNGKGFDPGHTKMGNGLRNMKNRSSQINATMVIDTVVNKGTTITLQFDS